MESILREGWGLERQEGMVDIGITRVMLVAIEAWGS